MIKDNKSNLKKYQGMNKNLDKALQYLETTDLKALVPGKYEIDGDNAYLKISEYTTKASSELKAEAHRLYGDIQYVVSGTEDIGVAELGDASPIGDFDTTKDIGFYDAQLQYVHLDADDFAILFPEDVHMPKCASAEPTKVTKALVKFRL